MKILSLSIDLSKIDKSKIIEGKNGAKYYNFTAIVNDNPNDYGKDISLCREQTKEQREAKEKRVYIGSGKTVWTNESKPEPLINSILRTFATEFTNRDGIVTKSDGDLPF